MAEKTIKIKVDKSGAQRALDQVNKALGKVGLKADISKSSVDGANTSMGKMIPIMSNVAIGLGAVGAAAVAGSTALIAFTRTNTLAIKEMEKSARLAGLNTQAFQAYAYAANSVSVSQEKFGDILKDVNDKTGDFISTGGGEFKDVFENVLEPMGVTIDQLKEMSSSEVLIAVNKGLEDLGANGQEVTFVLEAIANDAVLLQPLLEDNGRALNELAAEARDMGLIISQDQIDNANEFNRQFELLDRQVSVFGQSIAADLSPAMKELVELSGVLLQSLSQTFELGVDAKIINKQEEIAKLEAAIFERIKNAKNFGSVSVLDALNPFSTDTGDTGAMTKNLEKLRKELELLESTRNRTSGEITGSVGVNTGGSSSTGLSAINPDEDKANEDKLKRRSDYLNKWIIQTEEFNNTEQQNLDLWRDTQLTQLEEWYELNKDKREQYEEALYNIGAKWDSESTKLEDKRRQDSLDKDKAAQDERLAAFSAGQDALNSLADVAEGRSAKLNALVQGAAIFQASNNVILAASQALALPGDATVIQKMSSYALVATAGANLLSQFNSISEPSRQTGGYMMGDTPYQVGGGAHTGDPEMYQSGGKSYLIDSQAGMMTRVSSGSGTQSGQGGGVAVSINNYGQESTASVTDGGIDENGVRQMIIDMTPSIMAKEVNNASSPYRNAMSVNSKTQWDYS
ncbi:TMhelix containing protein [Vibrio phage 1.047.O._10N.286.55.F2]|nr:TMhelix containing protein [Vibrio phage 1.047.O._10N.286.55.F2]